MAKNKLDKILTAPDKEIHKAYGTNGVWSRMFRFMLKRMNITGPRFSHLMLQYLTDRRNGVPNNKKDQTVMRGNLIKEFSLPQMTWKVFCRALRFLGIGQIEIIIRARDPSGKPMGDFPITVNIIEGGEVPEDQEVMPFTADLDTQSRVTYHLDN